MQLIEQQKARIDELEDELEDKDEDRRLKQYEIDVKAEIEAAKIVAANPDASRVAAQAAHDTGQQFMDQAVSMQDVTESGEDEQESPEQPEQMEMPADEPVEMPEMQPVTEYIPDLLEITGNRAGGVAAMTERTMTTLSVSKPAVRRRCADHHRQITIRADV